MDRTPHYINTYLYFLETVGKLQQETWADSSGQKGSSFNDAKCLYTVVGNLQLVRHIS